MELFNGRKIIMFSLLVILIIGLSACDNSSSGNFSESDYIVEEFEVLVLKKINGDEEPVEGVQVKFADKQTTTNSKGVAIFEEVKAGFYKLSVETEYEDYINENVQVGENYQSYQVIIDSSKLDGEFEVVNSWTYEINNGNEDFIVKEDEFEVEVTNEKSE